MLGWRENTWMKPPALFLLAIWSITPQWAASQTSEDQVEQSFRAGQDALRRGEFARAAEQFKKVLALDPNLPEAEVNLGLAYQSLLEYDQAVRHMSKALREKPGLVGPTVIVGMDYLKLGSPDKAIPYLQRALKLDPSNRDAHEAMALYHLSRDDFQGAAEEYRQLAALDADKAEAYFKLGHQYLDLSARLAFRGARLYKDSAWGHRFLGDLLFQRGRWDDAAQEYLKALMMDQKQSGLHSLLGDAYLHAGKLVEAEAEFHRELQLDSRNELAWLGLANLQLVKGQALEALESVGKVWQISPEFLKVPQEFPSVELTREGATASISQVLDQPEGAPRHFLLAGLYAATNESALATREWKSFENDFSRWQNALNPSASRDPCRALLYSQCADSLKNGKRLTNSAHLHMGKIYFTLGQYEPAASALSQVLGDPGENVEASYWLERTYQALGADAYARLENSFPNSWRTHQLRAEGYANRRDLDNAIKEYQLALQLRPGDAELHEALGEFYLDNHSDGEALGELEKTVSLDPARTKALYLLGRLHVQNRENEKAVPYLLRALRLQPNLNEASGLLGTAYVRMGKFAEAIPSLQKAAPLDHFGNVHYQLYLAYRKLGQAEPAQKALARSQDLRRSSLEHDQALVLGSSQVESEPR
jgi:tetratricopeptide (TPR) repeat protein